MKRLIVVTLAFLVGCSGAGSTRSSFLPVSPAVAPDAAGGSAAANRLVSPIASAKRGKTKVHLTLRIPRRHRGKRVESRHPSTISPLTQSVSVQIDGGAVQVFNSTPTSAGCSIGAGGTTMCTFTVDAPVGSDTFVISTYNATSAGGAMLDRGVAVIPVAKGKANALSITLGPVASTTADSGPGSLRFAVGSANPGDTIMLTLPAGSTITLSTPITITNRVSIAGPGVSASARRSGERHASTTYSGITISGGGTQQIFVLQTGATVSISGLILAQGVATVTDQPGGAIYNAGTLSLVSDVLTGNSSTVNSPFVRRHAVRVHPSPRHDLRRSRARPQNMHPHCVGSNEYGGALYNHGTASITGTIFDGNTVADVCSDEGYGGAIYNDEYGVLNSSGNLYTNNGAYYGGAVYNDAEYGQASFASDTFSANFGCTAVNGCATVCAAAASDCTTYAEGYGAAIYDTSGPGVSITGSIFENNVDGGNSGTSYGEGGALYLNTGTPSITGSTFTGNIAGGGTTNCSGGEGGAIYLDSSGPLELSNDTFTGNKAGGDDYGYGGAIEAEEPIQGSNDTFSSNLALGTGSPCGTDGEGYGGAIYDDSSDANLNLSSSTFSSNSASSVYYSYAGAIYNEGYSRLIGDTFTSNSTIANSATDEYTYAYGGAIYNDGGSLAISGSTFTSNTVQTLGQYDDEAYGGAIYSDYPLSSTHDVFTSNTATASGNYLYPDVYGGAIYTDDTFASNGDTFASNGVSGPYYNYGGAIYSDSTATINNGTFTSNSATGGYYSYGGAIDFDSGSGSSISNSTVTSSVNTGLNAYGGAIDDEAGVTIGGTTISNNLSSNYGGGIYVDASETISNSTISGNSVPAAPYEGGGGGLYGDRSITLVNSTVSGNSVTANGIYAGGGGIYNDSGLSMIGSTISGNSVLGSIGGSGGGGIFNYDDATISNSTLTGNSSSIDGGGFLEYENYTVDLFNDTLFGNSATGNGGNIYNPYTITLLADSIVAGGSAGTGPDIANTGTLTSGDYNIIQTVVAGTALAGTTTHNQTANPLLLALSNNSGPTFTQADQASSPGQADIPFTINNGSGTATCGVYNSTVGLISVDQRGFSRGAGGRCDVGAYEFSGVGSAARVRAPVVHGNHHPKRTHPHPRPHPRLPELPPARPAQR